MRNKFISKIISIFCIASVSVFLSCHSSQELSKSDSSTISHSAQDPKFINNISLAGNTSNIKITTRDERSPGRTKVIPSANNFLQLKYSEMLGVLPQSITNLSLYHFIEDWYGVHYRMGGNDKNGIDCSGFVQRLYEEVFCTNLVRTAMQQFATCSMVFRKDSLKEGDLVFFHTRGRKRITHVGIYLMNNFFVHASSSQGVIISSLEEDYWSRYYAGAGEILSRESF